MPKFIFAHGMCMVVRRVTCIWCRRHSAARENGAPAARSSALAGIETSVRVDVRAPRARLREMLTSCSFEDDEQCSSSFLSHLWDAVA